MKSNLRKGGTTGPQNSGWTAAAGADKGNASDGYQNKRQFTFNAGGGAKEE